MTLKKHSATALLLLSLGATLPSCSKLDKMDKNATAAAENSGKAAKAASESREEIAYSRLMGRSGAASASRREAFEAILSLTEYEAIQIEASKYMKAFEYQLWTAQKYDTAAYRENMKVDSLKELFGSTSEVFNKNISKVKLDPFALNSKKQQRSLRIYALGAQLDGVHRVQEVVNGADENKDSTMYSVLTKAVKRISDVNKGILKQENLLDHEKVVQYYYEDAIALLEARYNIFLVTTLTKISDLKKSKVEALKLMLIKRSFESKFMSLNIGQQNVVNEKFLEKSIDTKNFLESIGIEVKTHKKIAKIYKKMKLEEAQNISISNVGTYEAQVKNDNLGTHQKHLEDLKL